MNAAEYEQFTDALFRTLSADPDVLGLVALGSTADPTHRDAWSDHDSWVVTRPGRQDVLLDDLSWLPNSEQILIFARHGRRHYGVLYRDGHMAELAVFDPAEATTGTVTVYRVLLDRAGVAASVARALECSPGDAARSRDPVDPRRRIERQHPRLAAAVEALLCAPVPEGATGLLELAEETLAPRWSGYPKGRASAVRAMLAGAAAVPPAGASAPE